MRSRSEVLEMLQQELNSADQQKQVSITRIVLLLFTLLLLLKAKCYKSSVNLEIFVHNSIQLCGDFEPVRFHCGVGIPSSVIKNRIQVTSRISCCVLWSQLLG